MTHHWIRLSVGLLVLAMGLAVFALTSGEQPKARGASEPIQLNVGDCGRDVATM